MDTEETDAIDIGVDEQLSENFANLVSLDDPVAVQDGALENQDRQKKESKEGECYIFNYQDFETKKPRVGSEKDAMRLKHDFTQLNLDVHLYVNLSCAETFKVLREASRKDHSRNKYLICCFLTHGSRDYLWANDYWMCIDDILKNFSASPSLKGIPKIFIFQACRGDEAELAVSTDSTDSGFSTDAEDNLDFLIINSTYLNTFSFKTWDENLKKVHGSFFIDEFCRTLEHFSKNLDLLQILTIVNFRMATIFLSHNKDKKELHEKKQMPCFTSTLRKEVKFNRNIEIFNSRDTRYFDNRRKRHGSGSDSTNNPLSDIKDYDIKVAKKILFLSIIDKSIGEKDSLVEGAVHLLPDFASKKYINKEFSSCFTKLKIQKFLDENNSQSGVDCLICYIVANSRYDSINDSICDTRGKIIYKEKIVETFIGKLNKTFVGKPKIFIFLLCKSLSNDRLLEEKFENEIQSFLNTDSSSRFDVKNDSVNEETNQNIKSADEETNQNIKSADEETDQNIKSADEETNQNIKSADEETNQNIKSAKRRFCMRTESTNGECTGDNLIPVHADILEICLTVSDWKHAIGPMNSFQEIFQKSPTRGDLLSLLTEFNYGLVEKHNLFQTSEKSSFSVTSTLRKTLFLP